jgi:hypothetical protein
MDLTGRKELQWDPTAISTPLAYPRTTIQRVTTLCAVTGSDPVEVHPDLHVAPTMRVDAPEQRTINRRHHQLLRKGPEHPTRTRDPPRSFLAGLSAETVIQVHLPSGLQTAASSDHHDVTLAQAPMRQPRRSRGRPLSSPLGRT